MDDLYDEFGNYIGDAESDEEESTNEPTHNADAYIYDHDEPEDNESTNDMEVDEEGPSNAVILHEDKRYHQTAQQLYGKDVETLVQEEDQQTLAQPIIAPVVQKKFHVEETDLPETYFSREFMTDLMNFPEQTRNIALAGQLHHGKTSFLDMLVLETHKIQQRLDKQRGRKREQQLRYTDTHILEQERGLSIKSSPMTLVLQSTKGKSHLINVIDTPGHVNFVDEVAAALRLTDGVVLVVDVVEGVQINTEMIIKHAVLENLSLVLVVNKMDRLILELKLPLNDAYFKLKHVIEEVNTIIENTLPGHGESKRLSPEKGNVAFACSTLEWCFTLDSFAVQYANQYPKLLASDFAQRLWGDIFYNDSTRKFTRKPVDEGAKRGFVHFILEPIYKLFSHSISQGPDELRETLATLGITLKPSQLRADAKDILKLVSAQFFGPATGFVDMITIHIPSPVSGAERYIERFYTGPTDSKTAEHILKCDQQGPLIIHVTKLFSSSDAKSFHALGRVLSGIASSENKVRVLGEGYTIDDEEDMVIATISDTWIAESRYQISTSGVPAGNWVLIGGIDNSIVKTATIVSLKLPEDEEAYIFKPIKHFFEPVFKVAVEPINPSELPKMLDGLRKINKSYPLAQTKVEESGEHIILGSGELYMDCLLHDLRRIYAEIDLKVSDPVTRFAETIAETSAVKCYAITPNKKNRLTFVAEPLDSGIAEDIESGAVSIHAPIRTVAKFFETRYDYDILAARNIWAFGPDDTGPNILQNDTLPSESDPKHLRSIRDSLRQGFAWATREGPLCEEPLRNAKFRLTDVALAPEALARGGGQVIPTARRACYAAFLMAAPRLLEPVYRVSVVGPQASVRSVYSVLAARRGHVLRDGSVAGTALYRVEGLVPVIDSFGFETELKINAQGLADVSLVFDKWSTVPGDPLDRSVKLRALEAATAQGLARDFVLKTRRRKGLAEDVSVTKFLEPELFKSLKESGILDG